LRDHPSDKAQRTFLFELLCFAGEYARAESNWQCSPVAASSRKRGAIVITRLCTRRRRVTTLEKQAFPIGVAESPSGKLNGKPFTDIRDADPDIGSGLKFFAAGSYVWIPFQHLASMRWGAATAEGYVVGSGAGSGLRRRSKGMDLGEVLIPAIYPFFRGGSDEAVCWAKSPDGQRTKKAGSTNGQKMLLVDGEEIPFSKSDRSSSPIHRWAHRTRKADCWGGARFLCRFAKIS